MLPSQGPLGNPMLQKEKEKEHIPNTLMGQLTWIPGTAKTTKMLSLCLSYSHTPGGDQGQEAVQGPAEPGAQEGIRYSTKQAQSPTPHLRTRAWQKMQGAAFQSLRLTLASVRL